MTVRKVYDWLRDGPKPLRRKARPVREDEFALPEFKEFCQDLADTMNAHQGRGLGSTQIQMTEEQAKVCGEQPWAMFALAEPLEDKTNIHIIVNPVITLRGQFEKANEGCLSFRSLSWSLPAPKSLHLEAQNHAGAPISYDATGIDARAIAHEYDHLQGKTVYDRVPPKDRQKFIKQVARHGPS